MKQCNNATMQRGVAIYLAIVVMAVLLSIGLGLSSILVGQIRMFRGMGDSVVAIYAADTGIEQELYEYRKVPGIPKENGTTYSGFLDIDSDGVIPPGVCPSDLSQDPDDSCYKVTITSAGVLGAGITFDAASNAKISGSSLTWSHTISGTDGILVVGVAMQEIDSPVTSITYGGVPLTKIGEQNNSVGLAATRVEMWYLKAPPVGTDSIVVTIVDSAAIVAGATSWTGVNQTSPLGSFVSAIGNSATPSVTLTSAPGEVVLDTVGQVRQVILTPSAIQTLQWRDWQSAGGPPINSVTGAGSNAAGASTVTMSWTSDTSEVWVIGAVPLKPPIYKVQSIGVYKGVRRAIEIEL